MNRHQIENRMFKKILKLTKGKLYSYEQVWIFETAYGEYLDTNKNYKTKIQAINKIIENTIELANDLRPLELSISQKAELSREFCKLYHIYIELDYRGQ